MQVSLERYQSLLRSLEAIDHDSRSSSQGRRDAALVREATDMLPGGATAIAPQGEIIQALARIVERRSEQARRSHMTMKAYRFASEPNVFIDAVLRLRPAPSLSHVLKSDTFLWELETYSLSTLLLALAVERSILEPSGKPRERGEGEIRIRRKPREAELRIRQSEGTELPGEDARCPDAEAAAQDEAAPAALDQSATMGDAWMSGAAALMVQAGMPELICIAAPLSRGLFR